MMGRKAVFKTPIGLLEQSGYKTHVLMSFQARAEELLATGK